MNWISVKERLPDKNGRYLTYDPYSKKIFISRYIKNKDNEIQSGVTHWMPLPEVPE